MSLKATGDARRPERWYDTERCTQELGLTVSSTLASGFTSKSRQVIKQASSCSCSSRSDKSCHAEQAQPPLTLAGPAQVAGHQDVRAAWFQQIQSDGASGNGGNDWAFARRQIGTVTRLAEESCPLKSLRSHPKVEVLEDDCDEQVEE